MRIAIAVALLVVGCGDLPVLETPDMPDVKPGDNAFIKAAWQEWGMGRWSRPRVAYIEGEALNCEGRDATNGEWRTGFMFDGVCIGGHFDQAAATMWIAHPNEREARRNIVHELCHAAWPDPAHERECSMAPGAEIDRIRTLLAP